LLSERQLEAFIHYGPAAISNRYDVRPRCRYFNPSELDAEQWVKKTAKSFGAKHIVLTAKDHNGILPMPTEKQTNYSIKRFSLEGRQSDVRRRIC